MLEGMVINIFIVYCKSLYIIIIQLFILKYSERVELTEWHWVLGEMEGIDTR